MSTDPDKAPRLAEPHLGVLPADLGAVAEPHEAAGRTEAQLRARVRQLEAALEDAGRCLEDAERRAAELLAARAEIQDLQRRLGVIATSRTWRLTAPLRSAMARVRRSVGRPSSR